MQGFKWNIKSIFYTNSWVLTVVLTDWQSASRNFFAVQAMKMMEADKQQQKQSLVHLLMYLW